MDEQEFQEMLSEIVTENEDIVRVSTFEAGGMLTSNKGITVTMNDGSQFQVVIVQSRLGRGSLSEE